MWGWIVCAYSSYLGYRLAQALEGRGRWRTGDIGIYLIIFLWKSDLPW